MNDTTNDNKPCFFPNDGDESSRIKETIALYGTVYVSVMYKLPKKDANRSVEFQEKIFNGEDIAAIGDFLKMNPGGTLFIYREGIYRNRTIRTEPTDMQLRMDLYNKIVEYMEPKKEEVVLLVESDNKPKKKAKNIISSIDSEAQGNV